ncbi:MFS-type transporter dbaD [Cladobotryum mycophilum]|uniref:MFS-type transporter dbaD n=1 Tax=Cladobotryum mycophilum TaxID=491253 RepID=A0ABR0S8A5_9HYPO
MAKDKDQSPMTENDSPTTPIFRMDHGLEAWLQVLGSWILFANTWGLTNSFGVFETYYATTLLPTSSPSAIAWIGSIQLFLTMVVGLPAGWIMDAGHLRLLLITGSFLEVFGMFMTSLCTKYWQFVLAQGVCVGIGSGLLGLPSVAVIPLFFSSKRMLATGIAATGSSLAGIVYPIMMRRLFVSIGFPWAVRALSFLMMGCLLMCCTIVRLRPRSPPRSGGPRIQLKTFRDRPFLFFTGAFTVMIASVYVPFFFVQEYALRLSVNKDMAFYLLSIMNATSLAGRIMSNWLADRYGGINLMIPGCFSSAIVLFLFRFAAGQPGLIAVSAVYGFISGGMVSLPPATIANLTSDLSQLGTRLGLSYTVAAFGALVGNPMAGAARKDEGSRTDEATIQKEYQGTWILGGSLMLLATGFLLIARSLKLRQKDGGKM